MDKNVQADQVIQFAVKKEITSLFKLFLITLEHIADDNEHSLEKLAKLLPAEYEDHIKLANSLDDNKYQQLRKLILGQGNDSIRRLEEELAKYDIDFKK